MILMGMLPCQAFIYGLNVSSMRHVVQTFAVLVWVLPWSLGLSAASKPHVITFGKWTTVEMPRGPREDQPSRMKVRPLYVDGKLKEFTLGSPHEITDHMFAVQRVIRLNDALPSEAGANPQWIWQRAGWMIVDRGSGHVTQTVLPQFDPEISAASWYRDYVAYCGVSADGQKIYATVVQLNRRKPVLNKQFDQRPDDSPSFSCTPPAWERRPPRVTFISADEKKLTYVVRGHAVELANENDDDNADTE
jgi:hypothetical protein